jgi:hypothetical protein
VVELVHGDSKQEFGPSLVGPTLLAQLGDKITYRYSLALPQCSMAITMRKGQIGVEIQNKDQASWPPDIFFIPAQPA